jgi:DNA-directed RNA polymerase specialized sigma24 family protein
LTVTTAPDVDHAASWPATTGELLHAAADGDQLAWRELVHRFEPVVSGTILDLGLQPADARDAAQRTWLQMVENHSKIRKPEALGGWLRTTARHECLRIIRERWRLDPLDDPDGVAFRDPGVDVEQTVVDADTVRRLRHLISTLPPRSALLLTELFRDEPPGYAELARLTGIPIGSIGPTRGRALHLLRALFDEGPPRSRLTRGRA